MSHIATIQSSPVTPECHYSGRAFTIKRFYKCRMGLRIKQLRKARGLTQQQLADMASMSRSAVAMIEKETRPANTIRLNSIAAALGVNTEDLFDSSDESKAAEADSYFQRVAEIMPKLSEVDRKAIVQIAESLAAKGRNT